MIHPKTILLISIVIFMDLLISSKTTKRPLIYGIYINIGTKAKEREREANPHIYPENRNRGCRKSFEKPNATGGFLFQFAAQYIICKAPACEHSHTGPPSSTTNPIRGSAEPFARAKRFLYVCNDANNFYASTLRRYSYASSPSFEEILLPFASSFVSRSRFIFYARTQWLARHIEQHDLEHYVAAYFLLYFASLKNEGCFVRHWWILILNAESGCTVSLVFMESKSSY